MFEGSRTRMAVAAFAENIVQAATEAAAGIEVQGERYPPMHAARVGR